MSKAPDPPSPPSQERTSLEGYLEYAVSVETEKTKDSNTSTTPPTSHDEETRPDAPDAGGQPTTEEKDPEVQERQKFLDLPKWKKRALFCCACLLSFLLQFDMAAVAVTFSVSGRHA